MAYLVTKDPTLNTRKHYQKGRHNDKKKAKQM